MKIRRITSDIWHDILERLDQSPTGIFQLMFIKHIQTSHPQMKTHLVNLINGKFISKTSNQEYKIEDEGLKFLEFLKRMNTR